jgi:hypothetical protein
MGGPNPDPNRRPQPPITYGWLWPGLPQLWVGGQWGGFGLAVAAAAALQTLLLTGWVWNELSRPQWTAWGAAALTLFWVIGLAAGRRWSQRNHDETPATDGDLFPTALTEYLQGNWFVAEENCRRLIQCRRSDVEARLLLVSLLRRTRRRDEARSELEVLAKFDGAARWQWEMAEERRRLERAEEPETAETPADEQPEEVAVPIRRAA